MKLLAGIIASVMAIDCPNDGWTANSADTECVPAASTVSITCSATEMVVTLDARHLYVEMDDSHVNEDESAAYAGTCTSSTFTSTDGTYSVTIPLDSCGTTVTQDSGTITFSNTVYGSEDAIKVDDIIITEKLELDVACTYSDSFDLTVAEIGVEAGTHELDGSSDDGDFSTEFSLASFTDAAYSDATSESNPVVIGSTVYNRVTAASLPTNVNFVVTDCVAQDAETSPAKTYSLIADGCLDDLTGTAEAEDLEGDESTTVDFTFNGFTFENAEDTLYLKCTIELCATDSNGDFVDSSCGFAYGGDDCADSDSTMGYTKASSIV